MTGNYITPQQLISDIWGLATTVTMDEFFTAVVITVIGLIVSFFAAYWLASLFIYKPKINEILAFENDRKRDLANKNALVMIQNDEALSYEEKMGENVGTSEDFAKLKY